MNAMELQGRLCRLRSYQPGDTAALCVVADDYMVARWMAQRFPHPYTLRDAQDWLAVTTAETRSIYLAIEVEGILAGGMGVEVLDGERAGTALFGYWLGRAYWGRGIATDASRTLADVALGLGGLRRLEASVFAPNVASARVLEKSGFQLEGRLRSYYLDREKHLCDGLLYARLA